MIHTFLKSIGFHNLTKNADLYQILEEVVNHPDEQALSEDANGNEFACFSKNICPEFGISVCGNFITENEFRMEYYFPYCRGSQISTYELPEIDRHAGKESYAGICDEMKLGVTLIFFITNVIDVLREKKYSRGRVGVSNTVLSALATSGKILLPIQKTPHQIAEKEKNSRKRIHLLQQAREGNKVAMENLTLNDMDTYSMLSRRVNKEDVLTIVESSFIPYGIESDQYIVIGEILNFYQVVNPITHESVWILTINCNDLNFDVCINARDLLGEPQIGRRFKGRIWMQGHLNFGY